jgi:hypothetical protein
MEPEGSLPSLHDPPLVPSQTNPVHNFQPYFPKIRSNIFFAAGFPKKILYASKVCNTSTVRKFVIK